MNNIFLGDFCINKSIRYEQIIWEGQYEKGRPVGEWRLKFRKNSDQPFI